MIHKTTKNYRLGADDPFPFIICRKKRGWKRAKDYVCIIVRWKYTLPRRLFYNFGCLSLKIVKLAFHWRWIFLPSLSAGMLLRAGWRYMNISYKSLPIVKWSTALSVKHHTKIQFFSSSGHTIARKCFLKTGEKKRVYATLLFSRVYLYRGQSWDYRKPAEKLQCKGLRGRVVARRNGLWGILAKITH